jgi:hypothetical protein
MDRAELAAEVFLRAYTPVLGAAYPLTAGLAWTIAAVADVPLGKWTFDTSRPTDGAIARLGTELALLWERAGLAARGVFNDGQGLVLLFRGEELLRHDDARRVVADAIRAANPHLGG